MKLRCFFSLAILWCASVGFGGRVAAQSAVLAEVYGRGVHAYNAGQYNEAAEWFNMAIESGFNDPRAYYFRGLTAIASGRGHEAEGDFKQGADIEAKTGMFEVVGRSLSRVQGSVRLQLETIRERARLQALASAQAASNARYGELGVAPSAGMTEKKMAGRAVSPPTGDIAVDPFADDLDQKAVVDSRDALAGAVESAKAENMAEVAGGPAATPAETGGFGAAAPAKKDPFGGGGADPFGGSGGGADPFGGAGAADPFGGSGGADPFGAGGDDPFGDSPF